MDSDNTALLIQIAEGIQKMVEDMSAIRISVERTAFEGLTDSRLLTLTDEAVWLDLINEFPQSVWMSVHLVNDGPDLFHFSINHTDKWGALRMGNTISLDHSHARRKIESIGFKCDSGETATIRVFAQY